MKIQNFFYEDKNRELQVGPITFNDDVTLLVGASGVGKTLILRTMRKVIRMAFRQENMSGKSWEVHFSFSERNCVWSRTPSRETLCIDGKQVIDEAWSPIHLYESALRAKLESTSRAKHQEKEGAEQIKEVAEQLKKLAEVNEELIRTVISQHGEDHPEERRFRRYFLEAFPWAAGIDVSAWPYPKAYEKGKGEEEEEWTLTLPWTDMPSGMRRAVLYLSMVCFCSEGAVLLIDNFGEGMGNRCLDVVVEALTDRGPDGPQFILTSHDPRAIGVLDPLYWKLITRRGGKVVAREAAEMGLRKSRHAAYKKLLQLEGFEVGVQEG